MTSARPGGITGADLRRLVRGALREDEAWNDVTSRRFLAPGARGKARLLVRRPGVVCGAAAAAEAFRLLDRRCRARVLIPDGGAARAGQAALEVSGPLGSLLSAERTALNLLSHLSGVATLTRLFVRRAGPGGPAVLDTRKTLPGLRVLEKWAVRCGGGTNHRAHLAAAVLIKENHLAGMGGADGSARLSAGIRAARRRGLPVEMEVRGRREILRGLEAGADLLLLDNFSPARLGRAVRWIRRYCRARGRKPPLLEASGGVTLENVRAFARTGVDRVSVGTLTHSAPALDVAMDVELETVKSRAGKRRR